MVLVTDNYYVSSLLPPRAIIDLARDEPIDEQDQVYLNRLSDLLFILARVMSVTTQTR